MVVGRWMVVACWCLNVGSWWLMLAWAFVETSGRSEGALEAGAGASKAGARECGGHGKADARASEADTR